MSAAEAAQLVSLLNAGSYQALESKALGLTQRNPHSGFAWKVLGVALNLQHRDALPAMQRAAELLPEDAEAQGNLGIALLAAGRPDDAVASLQRALAIKPDQAELHNTLGNALRGLGQMDGALASYRQAVALQPQHAQLHHNLGKALRGLRRSDEALASYQQALALKADYADAHSSLGDALLDLGRLEEAVASYRQALAIQPDLLEAHNNLGNALLALGQLELAEQSYRRVLEIRPDYAEVHDNLGHVLRALGRPAEAARSCRRALQIKPELAEAHSNLGHALLDLDRPDEAIASYERALALKPDFAEAYGNLASALRLQGRTAQAEASCRKALALNPGLAAAMAVLAETHADKGEFEQAEVLFRRAIAVAPDLTQAWAAIAQLRRMSSSDAPWLIEALRMAGANPSPRSEAILRYAIGKYFDDLQDFDRAFGSYQRANELTRLHTPAHDRQHAALTVDRLISCAGGQWLEQARAQGIASARPVFILGMPRSGTSLAEQILASHPQVFGAGELTFWGAAFASDQPAAPVEPFSPGALGALASDYLRLLFELSADAPRVIDKMPGNFLQLGLIHAALPDARFIHMQRNPVDTCLSIYFQDFKASVSYANDLGDLAHYYRQYLRVMRHWQSVLPGNVILNVPYEALVADPEGWSRRMLEFIGLPWDRHCLDFHLSSRSVVTASKWQVRQRMSKSSVARWRNYERHIGPLRALLPPA